MNVDVYEKITDQIVELLNSTKKGEWKKPWIGFEPAQNYFSNTVYSGFNQLYLSSVASRKFEFNRWLTFKQGNAEGARVKKGEKGFTVIKWDIYYKDFETGKKQKINNYNDLDDGLETRSYLKTFTVFNVSQFENLPDKYFVKNTQDIPEVKKIEMAENIINNTGAIINYNDGNRCYYRYKADEITLCKRERFIGSDGYYSTIFHELGHWTGHPTRLNRLKGNAFGSPEYAYEELIAEFTSAFLCSYNHIEKYITNNVAYIDSWLQALKNDKKMALKAAGEAQKAANFILNKSKEQEEAA